MKRYLIVALFLIAACTPTSSLAHPMGIKLWGHRLNVKPSSEAIQIDYVIEVPITKLALMMHRYKTVNRLSELTPADEAKFNRQLAKFVQDGIKLKVDGKDAKLIWNPNYSTDQGTGDMGFFEYRVHLIHDMKDHGVGTHSVEIVNDNYPMQRAVFHNELVDGDGAYFLNASFPYEMTWSKDEKERKITFDYRPGTRPEALPVANSFTGSDKEVSRDSELLVYLRKQDPTTEVIMIALVMAMLLGGLHALSPGHGKALVAAYLVGSRGSVKDAISLALIVTITHIFTVIILGIIGLILAQYIVPEYYAPFVTLSSGVIIVVIGMWLFVRRFRRHRCEHHHDRPRTRSRKQLFLLGIAGGCVPCPSATAVMLTAIAIGRIAWGFILILFFTIGLGLVLTVVGLTSVKTSSFIARIPKSERLVQLLPIVSAVAVTILGLLIIYYGFWVEWMNVN